MADCTHDCSSCSANCSSRQGGIAKEAPHELSKIKKVIGIVSGKGGVGKSLVTSMMAVSSRRLGYETAVLDADITGPSIPKIFGTKGEVTGCEDGMFPLCTKTGIEMISVNLLLQDEKMPVVWRGPVIAGTVKQFWTDVVWGDVDFMYVDMPPGTGDVPLTVFQALPIDGIVIVTSPQDLVSLIVKKAYNMANAMDIPVLGIVENMSYVCCPDCGAEFKIFGEGKTETVAEELGANLLAQIPIDVRLAELADKGKFEFINAEYLSGGADFIEETLGVK